MEIIEYFMAFTNLEIIEFLVNPLKKYSQLDIRLLSKDEAEIEEEDYEQIYYISLDGEECDFSLNFSNGYISLYTPNETCREFSFIHEDMKNFFVNTDLDLIYNGSIHDKSNKEILEIVLEVVIILIGTTKIELEFNNSSTAIGHFTAYLTKNTNEKKEIVIDNIKFIIN